MIKVHLSRLLGERKMKQSVLSRRANIRANTICDLYGERATAISFITLEAICRELNCDISDLLELYPNDEKPEKGKK